MAFLIKTIVQLFLILPLINGFLFGDWFGSWSSPVTPPKSRNSENFNTEVLRVLNGSDAPAFKTETEIPEMVFTRPEYAPMQSSMETTIENIMNNTADTTTENNKSVSTENILKMKTEELTTPAPEAVAKSVIATNENKDVKQIIKKKESINEKCYNKYPKAICENYRLYGYCETHKTRLAYYCEQTCGFCSDECFNEEKTCTQTENHCQPEVTHIPNEKCKALCGGCEVKLSQEHHQALQAHKNLKNQNKNSWPFDKSSSSVDVNVEY